MKEETKQCIMSHCPEEEGKTPAPEDRCAFWNGRAEEFSRHAASTGYPEAFIRIMRPRKNWAVLDMGCGGGTIAVPLAGKVKSVTAVDFSERMLDIVDQRCRDAGITNVETVQGRWEDDWDRVVAAYDVAIASRSLAADYAKSAIAKLDRAARKAVFISAPVGSGPCDVRLYESTGRAFKPGVDYIWFYNLLYEMGIRANVTFIPELHRNQWESEEQAFEDQRWMFRGMTEDEEESVRTYLKRHLVRAFGHWRLPYPRSCFWAVMWWSKDGMGDNAPPLSPR